ncbi:LacI family DNA-binding transcriptional regulator [Schleiferilactobacillus shenzhenensis]|uniref:HTH lacI-type domain-containing protein n=1 Tax=Schleiferilactobacillus shenzhenensis LY-73 TaxID=1231336 RepID=U4TIQ6_9LACO|nr:LacI family DNA-binding transcriptional regulator [Schleiferilactobacillus shenzhenensis]ERL64079.1 hypothetical protein L248_1612 [Schleiferilactobacillus shenzhenensis LY-73]
MMHHVTIKDIARRAGVSVATVSYALNGQSGVSPQMRAKIMAIAREMQYVPHMAAKILVNQTTPIVCGLVDSFEGVFNNELLEALQDNFQSAGYLLLVVNRLVPELIGSDLFRGLVVLNFDIDDQQQETIAALNVPTIFLANTPLPNTLRVVMDNAGAITLGYQELMKSVHQRLCIFTGRRISANNNERWQAVQQLYEQDHGQEAAAITFNGAFEYETAYRLSLPLFDRFDAFLCFNDNMALGIYKSAYEQGLTVGRDVSIMGFDNSILGQSALPGLTTVGFDMQQWAKTVVRQFDTLVEHPAEEQTVTRIPPALYVRQSIRYAASQTNTAEDQAVG